MFVTLLVLQAQAQDPSRFAVLDDGYQDHLDQLDIIAQRVDSPSDPTTTYTMYTVADSTSDPSAFAVEESNPQSANPYAGPNSFAIATRFLFQIDAGAGSIYSGPIAIEGNEVGSILSTKVNEPSYDPNHDRTEHWFWHDESFNKLTDSFTIVLDDATVSHHQMVTRLNNTGTDWGNLPYAAILFDYIIQPSLADTNPANYTGSKVKRYHFSMVQGGVEIGTLLREHHPNNGDLIVEHWLMFDDFEPLQHKGDRVSLIRHEKPPKSTAAFFSLYKNADVHSYVQPQYDHSEDGDEF